MAEHAAVAAEPLQQPNKPSNRVEPAEALEATEAAEECTKAGERRDSCSFLN